MANNSNEEKTTIARLRQYQASYVDSDRNTKLHYAAAKGDNAGVDNYLDKVSKIIDPENYLGWTPLLMACRNGRLSTVKLLIRHRANATKRNKFGLNVLHLSIASGNLELVEYILEYLFTGGISREVLEHAFPVITSAVLFQHQHILEFLTKKYFDLNKRTSLTDITPLMFAEAIGNEAHMKVLIENNADKTLKNCLGHTVADISTIRKQIKYVNTSDEDNVPAVIIQSPSPSPCSPYDHPSSSTSSTLNHQEFKNLLRRSNIPHPLQLVQSPQVYPLIFMNPTQILCSPNIEYLSNNNDRKYSNSSPATNYRVPNNTPVTGVYSSHSNQQHFNFPSTIQ